MPLGYVESADERLGWHRLAFEGQSLVVELCDFDPTTLDEDEDDPRNGYPMALSSMRAIKRHEYSESIDELMRTVKLCEKDLPAKIDDTVRKIREELR